MAGQIRKSSYSSNVQDLLILVHFEKKVSLPLICPQFPNKSYNQILLLANEIQRQMKKEKNQSLEK